MEELKHPFCSRVNEHCTVSRIDNCKECLSDAEKEILRRIYTNEKITIDEIYNIGTISKIGVLSSIEELKGKGILKEIDIDGEQRFVISKPCYKLLESLSEKDFEEQIFL